MDSSKKLYILIGILVLVILILFLVWFFDRGKPSQVEEGESLFPTPQEKITYQGEVYNIVKIGERYWFSENLKTETYRDGTAVPKLTDSTEWAEDEQGAYTCYYNQASYCDNYGALYNWYAVNNEKGICPDGWSVPVDEQWTEEEKYEFKAIFGGFRNAAGPFDFLDERGFWWTTTPSGDFAYARVMNKDEQEIRRIESSKSSGFSIRCVKD